MSSLTLAQIWPIIAGLGCVLISSNAFFLWRFFDQDGKEKHELFTRLRKCENDAGIISAKCEERFHTCAKCRQR